MATLKTIRKRIVSVKNTQKITKAMKMVSAAKLRRAQQRLMGARPYAQKMNELVSHIAALAPSSAHPLLGRREEVKKVEFLVLSSDRGLCGGFNGNLLRKVERQMVAGKQKYEQIQFSVVGKKGRDFFVARHLTPEQTQTSIYDTFNFEQALKMAAQITEGYLTEKFDEYYLAYNKFISAISQEVVTVRILPFEVRTTDTQTSSETYTPEYIYEPSRAGILDALLPKALATTIYQAFLESIAGEHGARMAAMDAATNNSREMIRRLTLQSNRLRQAAITKELMDIVNGAEAL